MTTGEWGAALRAEFGEFRAPTIEKPSTSTLGEFFEAPADAEEDRAFGRDKSGEELPKWVADKKKRAEKLDRIDKAPFLVGLKLTGCRRC